jgi:hypothetical protein
MAISWADIPLGESFSATMVHVVNPVKLTVRMMNFCVAQFSYFGNSLGMTLMLKRPSSSSAGVGFAFYKVALLVPRDLPVFNLRRTHMDAEHVGNLTPFVLAFTAWSSFLMCLAQAGDQFPADGAG